MPRLSSTLSQRSQFVPYFLYLNKVSIFKRKVFFIIKQPKRYGENNFTVSNTPEHTKKNSPQNSAKTNTKSAQHQPMLDSYTAKLLGFALPRATQSTYSVAHTGNESSLALPYPGQRSPSIALPIRAMSHYQLCPTPGNVIAINRTLEVTQLKIAPGKYSGQTPLTPCIFLCPHKMECSKSLNNNSLCISYAMTQVYTAVQQEQSRTISKLTQHHGSKPLTSLSH